MEGLLEGRDLSGDDDYYELLGCDENSSAEQIATEFKLLARKHHPDKEKNQDLKDKAEKYFMRLETAKQVLLDKELRAKYDQWRSGGFKLVVTFKDWLAMQARVHSSIHWAAPQKKAPSLPEPEKPVLTASGTTSDVGPQPISSSKTTDTQPGSPKRAKVESSAQEEEKLSPLQQFRKGSGKTTLLNTLAGQVKKTSGNVTLNGRKLTKKTRRKTSYVLQADIFFPNLTLRETIRYSALLRLPREYSFNEKLNKVEEVIKTLHLEDCAQTIIGNSLVRGLSGGEKKRTNISCELLTDPTLLLLDEPTSGLDSSSALSLMETLVNVASEGNKTVVTSTHQPSSQLYHMFDGLILMAKGKVAHFGKASDAMDYVASLGLRCTMHYNPADYLLELVSVDSSCRVLIGENPKQEERPVQKKWWQRLFSPTPKSLLPPSIDDEEKQAEEIVKYASCTTTFSQQSIHFGSSQGQ